MDKTLRILILEDNPADAELIQFELEEAEIAFTAKVVMTEKDFIHELQAFSPDIILSDYDLPRYTGSLALAEAKRRTPDVPFILVTGAVSEDRAIEILTSGSKDYVMKNRLNRLVPAVRRALAEAEEIRARRQAEADLREAHRTLEERVKIRTAELQAEIEARAKVEETLHKSEERQRLVLQASSMGTFEVDLLTGEGQWNATEFELLGLKPGDAPAGPETFFRFVHPDDVGRLRDRWEAATRTGTLDTEFRIVRADGRECWVAGKGRFFFEGKPDGRDPGDRGKALRFMGVNFDITEHKKAAEESRRLLAAISEEKERLTALINSIQDEIWFADTQKRFTLANAAALGEFHLGPDNGLAVEEFAASLEVYRPDGTTRPVEEAPPLRALQGEVVRNEEEIIRTPRSNELRHRQVSSSPVRDAGGSIIGSVSVVRDITESKRMEEALRKSEERYRNLAKYAPTGICKIDFATGRFTEVNEMMCQALGYAHDELFSMTAFDLLDADGKVRLASMIHRAKSGEQPDEAAEYRVRTKRGRLLWALVNITFRREGGRIVEAVVIAHDITARKRAEEATVRNKISG